MHKSHFIHKRFLCYWCVGSVLSFITLVIYWFTGAYGFGIGYARHSGAFLEDIVQYPYIMLGMPVALGFFIGRFMEKETVIKKTKQRSAMSSAFK